MGPTVREQRIGFEVSAINGRSAHLAGAVRAQAQALEGSINIVQCRFDRRHALVREITHDPKSTGERSSDELPSREDRCAQGLWPAHC